MFNTFEFSPTEDFFSDELQSQYVKDLRYTVHQGNAKLAALVDVWREEGKIRLIYSNSAKITGTDRRPLHRRRNLNASMLLLFTPIVAWITSYLSLWAVTHPTAVRNAIADLVVDRIDAGAGAGTLEFQTSGDVEVATLTFSDPAFGSASVGVATASAITSDLIATGGTIAKARAKDSDGTEVFACSVTATGGGGDITLNSVVVSAGQQVSTTSLTYTAPA